ncbi:hypothetical protein Barb6XT_00389 [Bacteroidales bacterium Barb6XT]|nr:hypothetical protein Barb6XT_00389 [Bacteroidales bacterium Barb6XT]
MYGPFRALLDCIRQNPTFRCAACGAEIYRPFGTTTQQVTIESPPALPVRTELTDSFRAVKRRVMEEPEQFRNNQAASECSSLAISPIHNTMEVEAMIIPQSFHARGTTLNISPPIVTIKY